MVPNFNERELFSIQKALEDYAEDLECCLRGIEEKYKDNLPPWYKLIDQELKDSNSALKKIGELKTK